MLEMSRKAFEKEIEVEGRERDRDRGSETGKESARDISILGSHSILQSTPRSVTSVTSPEVHQLPILRN